MVGMGRKSWTVETRGGEIIAVSFTAEEYAIANAQMVMTILVSILFYTSYIPEFQNIVVRNYT